MDEAIDAVNESSNEVHRLEKTYRDERTAERAARLEVLSAATDRIAAALAVLAKIREVV